MLVCRARISWPFAFWSGLLVFLATLIPLCFGCHPFRLPYVLLLFELGTMLFARDFVNVNRRLGELHPELLECLRDDPRDGEITLLKNQMGCSDLPVRYCTGASLSQRGPSVGTFRCRV